MHRRIRRPLAIVGTMFAVSAALAAAGPGSGAAMTAKGAHLRTGTVHVAKLPVGRVLVDAAGKTVYVFSSDKHHAPTCTGACAGYWPQLLAGRVHAGSGVKKKWLGTVKMSDGKRQVTYHHWPLYTFVGDKKNGEASGQGMQVFGGTWSTIGGNGHTDFRKKAATSSSLGGATGTPNSSSSSTTTTSPPAVTMGASSPPIGQGATSGAPPASPPPTTTPTTTPPATTTPTTTPPTTSPPPPYGTGGSGSTSGSGGW